MIAGQYQVKSPLPPTPGFEFAAEIEAPGRDVTDLELGQRLVAGEARHG